MKNRDFTENLIKGKIAEMIFEQMFRETEKFTILRFGYENTSPELAQYQHQLKNKKILEKIKHAPDFLLISQDKTEAYFVEVKFRSSMNAHQLKEVAEQVLKQADPSWLFVATPHGFYFEPCNTVIRNEGAIQRMETKWISHKSQEEYLELLNMFEPRKSTVDI